MAIVIPFLILQRSSGRWLKFGVVSVFLGLTVINSQSVPDVSLLASGVHLITSGGLNVRTSDSDRYLSAEPGSPWLSIYPYQRNERGNPSAGTDEFQAVQFIRANTRATETIFVGVKDHSRVFANDVRIYWLADRLPGSRYIDLDAGVASLEMVQREIISDLERSGTNWAVLEDAMSSGGESLLQRVRPPGSKLLDEFFLARFQEAASFGRLSVVRRHREAEAR